VNSISYKEFFVNQYESRSIKQLKDEFAKNVEDFVNKLKDNPKTEGFIVHNSRNKRMKRNIEKVISLVKKKGGGFDRVKTVIRTRISFDENAKLFPVKDESNSFPLLTTITIKE